MMGITKKPPVFVPAAYRSEIEKMSKAALMDMAWDLAAQCVESADDPEQVITKFRENRDIILSYRSQR
jgi:hypothetical protein